MYQQQQKKRLYKAAGGSYSHDRAGGTSQARKPSKPKGTAHTQGIPCRVKNAEGQYYDFMGKDRGNYLFVNQIHPDGHTFTSRHQASRAVWHTIERIKYENGKTWKGKDFVLDNVR